VRAKYKFSNNYLKRLLIGLATFTISLLVVIPSTASGLHNIGGQGGTPTKSQAVPLSYCTRRDILGLEPWWTYIGKELYAGSTISKLNQSSGSTYEDCDVVCFNVLSISKANQCGQTKSDIPGVLLAVIDDLLRIAGLAAVGFVFYGAFKYVASQGSPDATAQAQSTIINALIGLAIASVAVFIVNFIGNKLGG